MNHKLRIKHPSGAEFEAEGPAEFILAEKEGFLKGIQDPGAQPEQPKNTMKTMEDPDWAALTETRNDLLTLKNKHFNLKSGAAALLLLAAESNLRGSRELGAITLSKAVKASGYAPDRLDRILTKAIKEGLIKASGTKRNRAYHITDKGLEAAWLEARKLSR